MYVACSTMCFGRQPLVDALKSIGQMGFTKVDVDVSEAGPHLTPSSVASDPSKAAQILKLFPGVNASAFQVEFAPEISQADAVKQFRAVCRLARVLAASLVSLPAALSECDFEREVERLTQMVRASEAEGVTCAVETRIGTLTETPAKTIELCKRVRGLAVALDPSHFLAGPHHSQEFDELYPYIKHVRLRDSAKTMEKFQVRVGQGEIEYGKIVNQLSKHQYARTLSVDIRDQQDTEFPTQPEVRKLKYLLESLI